MYGWKKFDTERPEDGVTLLVPPSQQVSHYGGLLQFDIDPHDDFRVETIFFILFTFSFFVISLLVNPPEVTDFVLDQLIAGL
jgi:hypothetical protein